MAQRGCLTLLIQRIRRGLAAGPLAGILAGPFARVANDEPAAQVAWLEAAQQVDPADTPAVRGHGVRRYRAEPRVTPRLVLV